MADKTKVLVVGLGNMGASHASAYHRNPGFELVGLMSRSIRSRKIPEELNGYPLFENFDEALRLTQPDAVSINSWPNTHADHAIRAMNAGAHIFMEKPLATNMEDAEEVVAVAKKRNRKLLLGYILRVHPSWIKFIELGRTLGKPLVMRLNLNQQSNGPAWFWHKNLIELADPNCRLWRSLCRRHVPVDRSETRTRPWHRRETMGGCGAAELRSPPRHLRRWIGRMV